jgi:8-oxo-dGTP pyrophosphatase MutT (NUDIX family)
VLIAPFRELLSAYVPADLREREFVGRMHALLLDEAPFHRRSFTPGHFTASAFVLDPSRSSLLLILHKKLVLWLQPGGHFEPADGEAFVAARREVAEETGLEQLSPLLPGEQIFDVDIHRIPARRDEQAHEHFDVRFAFVAGSRVLAENEEVADARWVPLAEVARVTSDESVLRAVRKLLLLAS